MILQLSPESEYEGGSLVLEKTTNTPSDGDVTSMRQQGTVIAFASFMFHHLTPVTRGKRYSLVAWFEGPPFQ
jgi:PKHD-type hydroxylase